MSEQNKGLVTSHFILHVANTDATLDFWCAGMGATLESDEELASPALDAIFGREGVRIRDTFFNIAGHRIHTIETLDVKRERVVLEPFEKPLGLTAISFRTGDLEREHARLLAEGREPTDIYTFDDIEVPTRLFFIEDPNGFRIEMIE